MGARLYSQYKNRSNTTLISKNVNSASFDSVSFITMFTARIQADKLNADKK